MFSCTLFVLAVHFSLMPLNVHSIWFRFCTLLSEPYCRLLAQSIFTLMMFNCFLRTHHYQIQENLQMHMPSEKHEKWNHLRHTSGLHSNELFKYSYCVKPSIVFCIDFRLCQSTPFSLFFIIRRSEWDGVRNNSEEHKWLDNFNRTKELSSKANK